MKRENFEKGQKLFNQLEEVKKIISYIKMVVENKEEGVYLLEKLELTFYEIEEHRHTIKIPLDMILKGDSNKEFCENMLEQFESYQTDIERLIEEL